MIKPWGIIISDKEVTSNWLGTARSLREEGVRVIRLAPKSWCSSKSCTSIISPYVTEEREFLEFLIKIGKMGMKRSCRDVLFPSTDRSLILISKNKEKLKDYFELVVSDWKVVEKIVDKSETYEFAKKLHIPVPETFVCSNINEVKQAAEKVTYPCLIKPAFSHFHSWKFGKLLEVNSERELTVRYKAWSREVAEQKLLIHEKIPGGDDQIYELGAVFNKNSEPLAIFLGQKLRQYPPQFGIGSFTRSVWDQRLVDLGIRLLKELRFYGIAGVEFKKDYRTEDFKLLDINGRSWTQNYLATFCGLNLSYIMYKEAIGEKQKPLSNYSCNYKLGLKWIHLRLDFLSMLKMRKMDKITFAKWLNSILTAEKTFGILSLDDPQPFLSEIVTELKNKI